MKDRESHAEAGRVIALVIEVHAVMTLLAIAFRQAHDRSPRRLHVSGLRIFLT